MIIAYIYSSLIRKVILIGNGWLLPNCAWKNATKSILLSLHSRWKFESTRLMITLGALTFSGSLLMVFKEACKRKLPLAFSAVRVRW